MLKRVVFPGLLLALTGCIGTAKLPVDPENLALPARVSCFLWLLVLLLVGLSSLELVAQVGWNKPRSES